MKLARTIAPLLLLSSLAHAQTVDESLFKGMKWRLVGPFRGGRALAVSGVSGQPGVYYFGAVAGGVWKSVNGGASWTPVFDKVKAASIGSLAVAPSDPSVIYVGTGEGCVRGNLAEGNGVYKSVDAGRTWSFIGLGDSRHIGKVIVDPRDPQRAFVAALGHIYGPNAERGLFRTSDGGRTWQKVLFKDDRTGAIDVAFDPGNPNVLFAALWQVERKPWSLSSGGPGSGLYRSVDGGTTWKRLNDNAGNGLPAGIWGRIGVAISGADGQRVYAMIEAKEGGLFRSDDGGDSWTRVNDDQRYRQRAWYFSHVYADPKAVDVVYLQNTGFFRSQDGGKTFDLLPAPHGDHHGLWIDPQDPQRLVDGNDGGVTISVDGGKTWTLQNNQPTAQFYHVITDDQFPYHLYGAQQDNSSVRIASRDDDGTIDERDWAEAGGGESGTFAPDPRDPDIVYGGSGSGYLTRYDFKTKQAQEITVWPFEPSGLAASELEHRFQWTEPVILSPHDPGVLYTAGEGVWKSSDQGMSWTAISGDLTRNDKSKQAASGGPITLDITSVEYYDTVFALAESPVAKGTLWAGTDDGLVQVTRDGGKSWQNVTPKGMPEWGTVSQIDASRSEAGGAIVAVDRHRLDDLHAYAWRTRDFGKTWTAIAAGIPEGAFVRAVREDPRKKGLLFAGTELGVFVSFDDGAHWQPLQLNLPATPITDLVVKDDDLVVSTNGRSFWILDDIAPLRQVSPRTAASAVVLFAPAPAYRLRFPDWVDKRRPVGENPPDGAIIDYYLKTRPKDEVVLEILDEKGAPVRRYSSLEKKSIDQPPEWPDLVKRADRLPTEAGLNRFSWDLRGEDPVQVPGAFYWSNPPNGPIVLPGKYQVRLSVGAFKQTVPLELRRDPRVKASEADLRAQYELRTRVRDRLSELHQAVNEIRSTRAQLDALKRRAGSAQELLGSIADLDRRMTAVEEQLLQVKVKSSEGSLLYPNMLNELLYYLEATVESADTAPTRQTVALFEQLSKRLDVQLAAWAQLKARAVPALNALARKADIPAVAL